MDNLIAEGKTKPFLIVMTYGMTNEGGRPGARRRSWRWHRAQPRRQPEEQAPAMQLPHLQAERRRQRCQQRAAGRGGGLPASTSLGSKRCWSTN